MLCTVTGAEDALAVNNNAAAILLALAATARGGEVLVARGQLVEIGDGFRIPDILRESGARAGRGRQDQPDLPPDFEQAWTGRTRAVLRVHTSNYRIVGFTSEPSLEELAALAHERGAILIDDLGEWRPWAGWTCSPRSPAARERRGGSRRRDVQRRQVLGGPQAGIAAGRAATIEAMRRHPLARALRIDKLDLAALDAVLRLYLDPEAAVARIPTLARTRDAGRRGTGTAPRRLQELLRRPRRAPRWVDRRELVDTVARAGAGALPVTEVPSAAVAVAMPGGREDEGAAGAETLGPRRRVPRARRTTAVRRPRRARRGARRARRWRPRGGARLAAAPGAAGVDLHSPPALAGTAGHIDHGKTALVTRLTGKNPSVSARSANAASR